MLYLSFGLEILLMIGVPVALWFLARRWFGISWSLIGAGVITFIASRVVHLPLNSALGLVGGDRGVALWPLPAMAAVAGLSAGVVEEVARYLALRFWRREARSWGEGIAFGAGHGGVEAVTLGVLVAVNLVYVVALQGSDAQTLGLSPEQFEQFQADIAAFMSTPWYLPLLGGLERVFALVMHIAWTLLVVQALTRHNLLWLAAAVLGHAAVDGLAVGLAQAGWSLVAVEGLLFFFALGAGAVIYILRPGPEEGEAEDLEPGLMIEP
jgi:uncharacterized membrane protein YhfC